MPMTSRPATATPAAGQTVETPETADHSAPALAAPAYTSPKRTIDPMAPAPSGSVQGRPAGRTLCVTSAPTGRDPRRSARPLPPTGKVVVFPFMTELTPKQAELCHQTRWAFSDLRALFVNCTL